jgi:hypothetical protein
VGRENGWMRFNRGIRCDDLAGEFVRGESVANNTTRNLTETDHGCFD